LNLPITGHNYIINGNGIVNQRGNQANLVNGAFPADRWRYVLSGSSAVVSGRQVDGYIELDVKTADTSIAATDLVALVQRIEANNIVDFDLGKSTAKTVTLSFKHKHTKVGTYCVAFKNEAGSRAYLAEYQQSVSNTEEKAVITLPLDKVGTWSAGTSTGLQVSFAIAVGSNFHASAKDIWAAVDGYATAQQVNALDSTSNFFRITDVQLEVGASATSFEPELYSQTLAKCQRYYTNSFANLRAKSDAANSYFENTVYWSSEMRSAPSVTLVGGATLNTSLVALFSPTASSIRFYMRTAGVGDAYAINHTLKAEAEL